MVAIAAAAFALDNFQEVIRPYAPDIDRVIEQWRRSKTARHRRVSETIRRTFPDQHEGSKTLRQVVREIFTFRDWAVHPPADYRAPLQHDLLKARVEWRFVVFRASNAANAAGAATAIIAQCIGQPRETNRSLVKWCANQRWRSDALYERAIAAFPTADPQAPMRMLARLIPPAPRTLTFINGIESMTSICRETDSVRVVGRMQP